MEIMLNCFHYINVYTNTAVNVSACKILNIKLHLALSYSLCLTKISKSFCAVDTHSYTTCRSS